MPAAALPREVRAVPLTRTEVRADDDGEAIGFRGHAAVFDSRTWIGPKRWGFWEEIAPGAFRDVLGDDAAFLINHDPNLVLARNPATMQLSEDDTGLAVDADLARTNYGVDLAISLNRGDVTQMSFAFEVRDEQWLEEEDSGDEIRRILAVKRLWDVSAVTYPAYPDTDASLRAQGIEVLARHRGLDLSQARHLAEDPDQAGDVTASVGRQLRALRPAAPRALPPPAVKGSARRGGATRPSPPRPLVRLVVRGPRDQASIRRANTSSTTASHGQPSGARIAQGCVVA
jgi:HK97 family phage prohead protease